jgi:hypothetical protein
MALDYLMPAWNFAKGIYGNQNPTITSSMQQDLINRAQATGLDTGSLGYSDFGAKSLGSGRFGGGIKSLAQEGSSPFANALSLGRVSFNRDPNAPGGYTFGDIKYDFNVDDTPTGTGLRGYLNPENILRGINYGGLKTAIPNFYGDFKAGAGNIWDAIKNEFSGSAQAAEEAPLFNVDKVRDMIATSGQDGRWITKKPEDDLMNYDEHYNTPIVEAPTGAAAGLEALKPFVPGAALRFLNSMIRPGADQSAMGIGGLYGNEVGDINFARQYGDPDVTRLLGSDPRVDPYGKNIVSGARNYNQGVKDWVEKYGDVNYKTDFMKKKQQYYKNLVQDISRREEQRAIEEERARSRAETARQQQALASSQDWTGASSDYRGGDDTPQGRATGNYHDPYDPGHAD